MPAPFSSVLPRLGRLPGAERLWRERWWLVAFAALLTLCRLPTIDGWDEAFYVGQLTSAVGDRDLRLQDDVALIPKPFWEKCRILTTTLPSGALANTFSIGPAILLSAFVQPFVSAASPPPWLPFRAGAAFAAMSMLLLTAILCAGVARRFGVSPDAARLAAGLALLGSPLALYATRSYLNAHAWGGLLVALTLHQATAWVDTRRPLHALALGLAAGLACVNRWQDAVIVIPVVLLAVAAAVRSALPWRAGAALVALAAVLSGACQLLAWRVQFGTPFLVPQGGGYLRWLKPAVVPLVFSSYHGLLPWAPGLALGLLALMLGWRRSAHRWLLAAMACGSVLAVYVSACPEDWWGRDAFGPRRLASLTPIAAVGMALLLGRLRTGARILLTAALGLWAAVVISAHLSGHDDLLLLFTGTPDPFRPAEATMPSGPTWINSWGALHSLKPGFSFSDAPRLADRLIGMVCVALVVAAMRFLRQIVAARGTAQRLLAGLAAAHVLAWLQLLALLPPNAGWNAQWKSFLDAPLDSGRAAGLPPEMSVARDVVIAGRAANTGDRAALRLALDRLRQSGIAASAEDAERCRTSR